MTITLDQGSAGVYLPQGLARLFAASSQDPQVSLRALDERGDDLPPHAWTFVPPSWVLDTRRAGTAVVRVEARSADGQAFAPQARVTVTIASGGQQYRADFTDLAGRTSRELLIFELADQSVLLALATRQATPSITVFVDGSASMLSREMREPLQRILEQLVQVTEGVAPSVDPSGWFVLRGGAPFELTPGSDWSQLWAQPRGIGSVFADEIFRRPGHYVVVTDDLPEGTQGWTIADGALVQMVVVGATPHRVPLDLRENVKVHVDAGSGDGSALASAMAKTFGWEK